jgi:hypothetical protein
MTSGRRLRVKYNISWEILNMATEARHPFCGPFWGYLRNSYPCAGSEMRSWVKDLIQGRCLGLL